MGKDRARLEPERLRMARELAGLSQADLADAVGITAAAISQYERGVAGPGPQIRAALAKQLAVSARFLVSDTEGMATPAFFRSLRSAPAGERKRARHYTQLVHDLVRHLDEHVRLPSVDVPCFPVEPAGAETAPVEAARLVRQAWGIEAGPIANVVRLIEQHGVVVCALSGVDSKIDAFSVPFADRPVVIMATEKSKRDRSRFDVAHELGHLVMHDVGLRATRTIEKQAHAFAAEFLMPARDIRSELPRAIDWSRLIELKKRWGTSIQSLLYRANTLEVMNDRIYEQAMKTVSARGWRRHEPGDLGAPEMPALLRSALETAGILVDELAERTAIPAEYLRSFLGDAIDSRPPVII